MTAERGQRHGSAESIGRLIARELRSGNKRKCLAPDCNRNPPRDDLFCAEHTKGNRNDPRSLVAHGRKHGALLNADNEAWDAIDALLTDRQSLSDRIDGLEAENERQYKALNAVRDRCFLADDANREHDILSIVVPITDQARAALHQEGI